MPPTTPPKRTRWELVLLATSALLLVASETILRALLTDGMLLVIWSLCFLFTGIALILAWIQLRRVRRQWRESQLEAFRGAFDFQSSPTSSVAGVAPTQRPPAGKTAAEAAPFTQAQPRPYRDPSRPSPPFAPVREERPERH